MNAQRSSALLSIMGALAAVLLAGLILRAATSGLARLAAVLPAEVAR